MDAGENGQNTKTMKPEDLYTKINFVFGGIYSCKQAMGALAQ